MQTIIKISLQILEQLNPGCNVFGQTDNLVKWKKCVNNGFDNFSTSLKTGISSETDQKPNSDQLNKQIYYDMCCGTWFIKDCILEIIKVNSFKF